MISVNHTHFKSWNLSGIKACMTNSIPIGVLYCMYQKNRTGFLTSLIADSVLLSFFFILYDLEYLVSADNSLAAVFVLITIPVPVLPILLAGSSRPYYPCRFHRKYDILFAGFLQTGIRIFQSHAGISYFAVRYRWQERPDHPL